MLLIDPPHPEKHPWKYIPISQYLFPISGSYSKQLICKSAQNALSKGLGCWTHTEDKIQNKTKNGETSFQAWSIDGDTSR